MPLAGQRRSGCRGTPCCCSGRATTACRGRTSRTAPCAYSSALIVSGLSMTTLFLASTILPPNAHTSQCVQVLPSPVALPSAKPTGVPFSFSALHSLRKPSVSFGNCVEARRLQHAGAIDERVARAAQRNADPFLAVRLQVLVAHRIPAAVLGAEIVGRRRSRRPVFPDTGWHRRWSTEMMSGPAPVFAATAAFGRTSSQPSLSTRTSMPVFSVNLVDVLHVLIDRRPARSGFQRSTRSFAPFSGAFFHCALASLTQIIGPTAAAGGDACRGLQEFTAFEFTHQLLLENCARFAPARLAVDCCGDDPKSSAFCDEPHTALRIE